MTSMVLSGHVFFGYIYITTPDAVHLIFKIFSCKSYIIIWVCHITQSGCVIIISIINLTVVDSRYVLFFRLWISISCALLQTYVTIPIFFIYIRAAFLVILSKFYCINFIIAFHFILNLEIRFTSTRNRLVYYYPIFAKVVLHMILFKT